ncbi:hypothetical protein C8Q77DRAFT_805217 [Trametes polyzona]|nr:hypothetical protein C8Q77DRAFT_805217 [Trametes polyzona]
MPALRTKSKRRRTTAAAIASASTSPSSSPSTSPSASTSASSPPPSDYAPLGWREPDLSDQAHKLCHEAYCAFLRTPEARTIPELATIIKLFEDDPKKFKRGAPPAYKVSETKHKKDKPRARNEFLIFRQSLKHLVLNDTEITPEEGLKDGPESKVAGHIWQAAKKLGPGSELVSYFKARQLEVAAAHKAMLPDYKYRPQTKEEKKSTRGQRQAAKGVRKTRARRARAIEGEDSGSTSTTSSPAPPTSAEETAPAEGQAIPSFDMSPDWPGTAAAAEALGSSETISSWDQGMVAGQGVVEPTAPAQVPTQQWAIDPALLAPSLVSPDQAVVTHAATSSPRLFTGSLLAELLSPLVDSAGNVIPMASEVSAQGGAHLDAQGGLLYGAPFVPQAMDASAEGTVPQGNPWQNVGSVWF